MKSKKQAAEPDKDFEKYSNEEFCEDMKFLTEQMGAGLIYGSHSNVVIPVGDLVDCLIALIAEYENVLDKKDAWFEDQEKHEAYYKAQELVGKIVKYNKSKLK